MSPVFGKCHLYCACPALYVSLIKGVFEEGPLGSGPSWRAGHLAGCPIRVLDPDEVSLPRINNKPSPKGPTDLPGTFCGAFLSGFSVQLSEFLNRGGGREETLLLWGASLLWSSKRTFFVFMSKHEFRSSSGGHSLVWSMHDMSEAVGVQDFLHSELKDPLVSLGKE